MAMLIQIQKSAANSSFHFYKERDCLEQVAALFKSQLQAIKTADLVSGANSRTLEILHSFKYLLAERKHTTLCEKVSVIFPKLFNFEACAVLFFDKSSGELFSIKQAQIETKLLRKDSNEEVIKDNDKVVKYPTDLGCTGLAIQSREFYYFNAD